MLNTTVGHLLLRQALPPDLYREDMVLDKKGVADLMTQVAERYPNEYASIAKKISDVGRHAAFTTGGHSFGLHSLKPTLAGRRMRFELGRELRGIYENPNLTDDQRDLAILQATQAHQKPLIDGVLKEATEADNPLSRQLRGAGRGNKNQLSSLLGADLLYTDHRGDPLPIPVLRSYSQGLSPVEYFAGAFGARKGVLDTKMATQDAGFLGKQMTQVTHRLLVTGRGDEDTYDERSPRGLPVDTTDPDNEGARLAHPIGGYSRNTELTPRILKDLHNRGHSRILVRSPTVGGPADGGVYALDVGRRERGDLPPRGDYVGIAGAQALSEPISQSQLSSKHSGGVAGATAGAVAGFKGINQLIQVPKTFQGGAAHARADGTVHDIVKAPQGGHYVTIGVQRHYVGQGYPVTVKVGQNIEAGDLISEGTANPAEIVEHKGLGAGRQHFTEAFHKVLKASGITAHRRNIELLSRGLINHVRLEDEVGDWAPGDVIPYQSLERNWEPRTGSMEMTPASAVGKYLERPVLHHTIGTKIRPSMLADLQQFGVNSVTAHHEPPPFVPEMQRGMANVSHDPDWMTRMLGGYQQKSLLEGARRGAVSDESGSSYVPALARGENFGLSGSTKNWHMGEDRSRAITLGSNSVL